jgi:ferredoxin
MLAGEVFVVTEETALVRPDADLASDENVREAADICPVEVIRYRE